MIVEIMLGVFPVGDCYEKGYFWNRLQEHCRMAGGFPVLSTGFWDLIFVDFNNFTLTQLKWLQLLKSLITKTSMLIFSDSACFGFHRFPKNLKCYRVDNPQQYYFQLSEVLGGYLRAVVDHYNSAVVAVGARPYSGEVFWQRLNPNDCRNYARRVSGRGLL